jgi:C4-dicarboxylate transporter DctM subunit
MVVYAAATEQSVGQLFMAGVIPGILLGLMLMTAIYFSAHKFNIPVQKRVSFRELLIATRDAIWGLGLIIVVMGGIYGGIFTATEAAAVAAVYAFIVALFVHRDMGWSQIPHVFADAAKVTVMLLFIITNAFLFAHVLTTERIPQMMAETIVGWGLAPWQFLIVVNIVLLIAGNFMEPSSILLILAPIFFPIATHLGIDPIHLGIIMVVNMEIGMITPPVGLNLFVTAGVTGMPLWDVVKAAMPWLMVMLSFLIIVTYVPQVSLFLPQLLF